MLAFFLADTTGSESAAAKACITAAHLLRDKLPDIAVRSELPASELSMRFGLHWGPTLYIGRILTGGRSEVTALGDEMNEAARIEACATGGRTLASKSLIERLNREDANTLGLDTGHTTYTPLADLSTVTDKARRDAPSIAVCERGAHRTADRCSGNAHKTSTPNVTLRAPWTRHIGTSGSPSRRLAIPLTAGLSGHLSGRGLAVSRTASPSPGARRGPRRRDYLSDAQG